MVLEFDLGDPVAFFQRVVHHLENAPVGAFLQIEVGDFLLHAHVVLVKLHRTIPMIHALLGGAQHVVRRRQALHGEYVARLHLARDIVGHRFAFLRGGLASL